MAQHYYYSIPAYGHLVYKHIGLVHADAEKKQAYIEKHFPAQYPGSTILVTKVYVADRFTLESPEVCRLEPAHQGNKSTGIWQGMMSQVSEVHTSQGLTQRH